ncbi:hypothetical protein Bbelb_233770 [Branchiostoma belcheri]|nr:hypothetical protein Bbelb_233770 [Branchiostoma belcheri]
MRARCNITHSPRVSRAEQSVAKRAIHEFPVPRMHCVWGDTFLRYANEILPPKRDASWEWETRKCGECLTTVSTTVSKDPAEPSVHATAGYRRLTLDATQHEGIKSSGYCSLSSSRSTEIVVLLVRYSETSPPVEDRFRRHDLLTRSSEEAAGEKREPFSGQFAATRPGYRSTTATARPFITSQETRQGKKSTETILYCFHLVFRRWTESWFHGPVRIVLGRMPLRPSSNLKMRADETEVEWVERIRTWYKAMWKREKENDDRRRRERTMIGAGEVGKRRGLHGGPLLKIYVKFREENDDRCRRELKAVTQSIGDYFRRAKRLGVSWVPMAAELGLTPVDVAVIKTDSGDIHEQIERVIYQWRYYMVMDGFSMNITVDSLIDFLEESLVFYDMLDYLNKTAFKTMGKTWEPKYEVPPRRQSQDNINLAAVGTTYRSGSTSSMDSTVSTDSDIEAD